MMKFCNKTRLGQGTIEYLLLITAVIMLLLVFLRPGGIFSTHVNESVEANIGSMEDIAERIYNP